MINHLYIIGNGFDLHHGINSSYRDFMVWMNNNHCDVMCKTDEIYGVCDYEWWSDFENQLASLDVIRYSSQIASENQPDLTSEHCDRMWEDAEFEVEKQLEELYSELRECFHEWILQLKSPLESRKVDLVTRDAVFMNFNYTKTLENLYGIYRHNVLHIHGCIDEDENFILGHGKSYDELKSMNATVSPKLSDNLLADGLAEYYEEFADGGQMLHEQLAEDAAYRGVSSQRKPVEEIIKKHNQYFNSLATITEIHIYGLSLSEIDIPYLKHILSISKSAKWEFSDYNCLDQERIVNFCKDNNIVNFSIINLADLVDTK